MAVDRATLITLIEALSKRQAIWVGEPMPGNEGLWGTALTSYIECAITSYRQKGGDDYREVYDTVTNQFAANLVGIRAITLQLKCISFDFSEAPFDVLEQVRTLLSSYTARSIIVPRGIALVDWNDIAPLPNETRDNREVYTATMDVKFSFAINVDVGDDPGQSIETVDGGGTIPGDVS